MTANGDLPGSMPGGVPPSGKRRMDGASHVDDVDRWQGRRWWTDRGGGTRAASERTRVVVGLFFAVIAALLVAWLAIGFLGAGLGVVVAVVLVGGTVVLLRWMFR